MRKFSLFIVLLSSMAGTTGGVYSMLMKSLLHLASSGKASTDLTVRDQKGITAARGKAAVKSTLTPVCKARSKFHTKFAKHLKMSRRTMHFGKHSCRQLRHRVFRTAYKLSALSTHLPDHSSCLLTEKDPVMQGGRLGRGHVEEATKKRHSEPGDSAELTVSLLSCLLMLRFKFSV